MGSLRAWRAGEGFEALEHRVLFAADPITPDHPLWLAPRGAAIVDGVVTEAEWHDAFEVTRSQAWREQGSVRLRMMHSDAGLFLALQAEDDALWADGLGGGSGDRWEVESDDSVTFYVDPDGSRDEYFQSSDRAFGVSIGNPSDPLNGDGTVRRWKFVRGDGAGGAPDVNPGGVIDDGTLYATTVSGTVNDNADTDTGWATEVFLPWASLNMSAPTHGTTIGLNFDIIFDNDGGTRNYTDNRESAERFTLPAFVDDHVQGVHSSYHASQAGIRGPVNYANLMFINPAAGEAPAAVTPAVDLVSAHAARLSFAAPAGTTGGLGHASAYEIRLSTTGPISSEGQWRAADEFRNAFVPRPAGLTETLWLSGLAPGTAYHVAVRAVDGAGNLAASWTSVPFTTSGASAGDAARIMVSPNGGTLVRADGTAFVPVGDHLGLSWAYTRNLYPGDVWDPALGEYHNFHDEPSYEGPAGPYFDELAAHGVNTMRLFLELPALDQTGNPEAPRGRYWIEYDSGTFNADMRAFVENLLAEADSRGIYVILSPFDTFAYDDVFSEISFSAARGGPLSDINDFFQNPQTLTLAQARMATLISWVQSSPYAHRVLGYEPLNEWDSYEWTLNSEGDAEPGRETEMRRRAQWIAQLNEAVRELDPERLVLSSTTARDPRGPLARLVFQSRSLDVLAPHLYTNASEEPINNPDQFKQVRAAVENGLLTAYWLTHRADGRPILNGEWGMTRADWPGGVPVYGDGFSQADDEALFRTLLWSGLAAGQVGTGLRIAADELSGNQFLLTDAMRDTQRVIAHFVAPGELGFDFADFRSSSLEGRIDPSSAAGRSLLAWGVSDGAQGIAYVLQDLNETTGAVADGVLTIHGLTPDQVIDVEFWSTAAGTAAPSGTLSALYTGDGTLEIALPEFTEDLAVRFKARAGSPQVQDVVSIDVAGKVATFRLGDDAQPIAELFDPATGQVQLQDISAIVGFRGRAVDMTPYTTGDGLVHLAITDTRHAVWLFSGNIDTAGWTTINLTETYGFAGLTGDLTTYQPSWGTIHIAALDARGHAVNYWWAWDRGWGYDDLTAHYGGPTLARGLTGYVAPWDGLNLAGLNDAGEVVVYWWAPDLGDGNWAFQNMTSDFAGPTFTGQLDAYVTPWGALNITGLTDAGAVWQYWWVPTFETDPHMWRVTNISEQGAGPALASGVEAVTSADGGLNLAGVDASGSLHLLRWVPGGSWTSTDVSEAAGGITIDFPIGAGATGTSLLLSARRTDDPASLVRFWLHTDTGEWESAAA